MSIKVGDKVKIINVDKYNKHLLNEEGIIIDEEKDPDWRLGDVYVRLNFDPTDTYTFREEDIQLIESSPPEYIPVGTSIDRWMKNPEFINESN